eukprot:CAMPEP_0178965398 /NCGR_PEP_ID=MMETSP0789-20121207/16261_1 /TAXON_ID=3005 /ORGANISM="Rhizosolenia setigera, Strain CCMP 1694" /LENGTH=253 /DNA_ID=CAMNT_0020650381 /DNA_START=81 /DNA_END=842 /DNA_ORIENTATION=+
MPNTATASAKGKKKAESDAPQDAPPEKKAKSSGADEGKKEEEKLTPHKAYFKRLKEKVNELDTPKGEMLGHILIKGISSNRDSDDEESESESESKEDQDKYTEEQMNSLRFILITKNRAKMMDDMKEFVLGEQANDSFMMFNTSFSWEILSGFSHFKKNIYQKKKSWKLKFDVLLAYTRVLHTYDVWMNDNEGQLNDFVRDLAKLWKAVLKKSDEDLGIDSEYTRPGVLEFLKTFKEEIESACAEPPFKFNYC